MVTNRPHSAALSAVLVVLPRGLPSVLQPHYTLLGEEKGEGDGLRQDPSSGTPPLGLVVA